MIYAMDTRTALNFLWQTFAILGMLKRKIFLLRITFFFYYILWQILQWRQQRENRSMNKSKLKGTVKDISQPWLVINRMERIAEFEKIKKS